MNEEIIGAALLHYTLDRSHQPQLDGDICRLLLAHQYEELIRTLATALHLDVAGDLSDKLTLLVTTDPHRLHLLGVALLQLFVQVNWTGVQARHQPAELMPPLATLQASSLDTVVVADGDSLNASTQLPVLLAMAKIILVEHRVGLDSARPLLAIVWSLRCCLTLQAVLEEKSEQLHEVMVSLTAAAGGEAVRDEDERLLLALYHLEAARFHSLYYEVRDMVRTTEEAGRCVGLSVKDTGALGRRTKYQVKDIAQFALDFDIDATYAREEEDQTVSSAHLPVDLRLDDEVRLEKIHFAEAGRDRLLCLDAVQQCVLMARFCLKRRAIPSDELALEELQPHLIPLLEHPVAWSLYTAALLNRSMLECKYSRSVERARAQLETILENLSLVTESQQEEVSIRMRHIHGSRLPPMWEVERGLADILLSLGATKGALDRYMRLQRWDEVIACFNLLQMRHKAAEVIKEQMKKGETARLWCQLGDATDDLQCYHKALELSNNKSARAFKSLGLHYYFSKDYSRAVDYFEQSLHVSRFQLDIWLRLGFAALELENWSVGARAYRSYTSLESDNFEAWNNLAKCYIKLGQKQRAWRVLHEAIRCDYDNWKVWDNLMVIAADLAVFDDVLRAYSRILDLKQTHLDGQVLGVLVKVVTEGIPDSAGLSSAKYRESVAQLLARLTVSMPREPEPWHCYATLLLAGEPSIEDRVKGCQYLQKSMAAHTSNRGWEKDPAVCREVLSRGRELAGAIVTVPEPAAQLQLANSARLALISALRLVEKGQTSLTTGGLLPDLSPDYDMTQQQVNVLVNRVGQLKAAATV